MPTAATKRRVTTTVALAAALTMVGATAASAHHCYKDEWADAAYRHHLQGGTPWVPLSDLAASFLPAECAWVADEVVADFMADNGMAQEPLIHSRATVGGGAMQRGNDPRPFSYLTEAQFETLTIDLMAGLEACAG
jgi:hypothetical protein